MSMLARYRKKGGFEQLLTLIETCSAAKREQLLKLIQAEDPSWASLIRAKTLTIEKFMSWKPESIGEVIGEMSDKILVAAFKGFTPEHFEHATATMARAKRSALQRQIDDSEPTPGEIETARMKIVSRVRELERDRRLDLTQIDPAVSVMNLDKSA